MEPWHVRGCSPRFSAWKLLYFVNLRIRGVTHAYVNLSLFGSFDFFHLTFVTSQRIERLCVIPSGALLISSARYAEGSCAVTELSLSALTNYVTRVRSGPPYLPMVNFAWLRLTIRLTVNKFKLCVHAVLMYISLWLVRRLVRSKENALCTETPCVSLRDLV
jgi:hypothetical protein